MKLERQAAVEAILMSGHIPAGMELFAAEDRTQWETIKRWIDDSDALLLLLGGRYGSVASTEAKSYTHMEYEYAQTKGIPAFGIVLEESWNEEKLRSMGSEAIEKDRPAELRDFREQVRSHTCKQVGNTDQLKLAVVSTLSSFAHEAPQNAGWQRTRDVSDPGPLIEQIRSLQEEIVRLKSLSIPITDPIGELKRRLKSDCIDFGWANKILGCEPTSPLFLLVKGLLAMSVPEKIYRRFVFPEKLESNSFNQFMQILKDYGIIKSFSYGNLYANLVFELSSDGRLLLSDLQ